MTMIYKSIGLTLALVFAAIGFGGFAHAAHAAYTYNISVDQPWTTVGTTSTQASTIQVRTYVPGSNTYTTGSIPLYTQTVTSGQNTLGDIVGYTRQTYGTPYSAFVDPYDGTKYTANFPGTNLLGTKLYDVNDERLALGEYLYIGGKSVPIIFDLQYKVFTVLPDLSVAPWDSVSDMNNAGQIVGIAISDAGATRKGFVYDCETGSNLIDVPGSNWTVPQFIDENGNIYGWFTSDGMTEKFFVAQPDASSTINCSLVGRDDKFSPLTFNAPKTVSLVSSTINGVTAIDVTNDGTKDLIIDHGTQVVIYTGESNYTKRIKYSGETFATIFKTKLAGYSLPANNDANGDGFADSLTLVNSKIELRLGKSDGSYYYVPQVLDGKYLVAGNSDALLDLIKISGKTLYLSLQVDPNAQVTDPNATPSSPTSTTNTSNTSSTTGTPATSINQQPYLDALQAAMPGCLVKELQIDKDTLTAQFQVSFNGKDVEGGISSSYIVTVR